MSSKSFIGFSLIFMSVMLGVSSTAHAADYYVDKTHAQASDSNPGAESLPWKTIRHAADVVKAGDTVYVKGNGVTYTEPDPAPAWIIPTLNPKNSGTASQPITFSAFPGHTVKIENGSWSPVIGAYQRNYIIWQGFTISRASGYHTTISESTGSQLRYNEIIGTGQVNDPSRMYTGIIMHGATGAHIHHNSIHGFRGNSNNQAGIIAYHNTGSIIEDNYVYDCWAGLFSKQANVDVTWRRNWSTNHQGQSMTFNFAGFIAGTLTELRSKVYDNVFDHVSESSLNARDNEFHDNLIRAGRLLHTFASTEHRTREWHIWNNVIINAAPWAWHQEIARVGDEFDYFDYNIYTGTPTYRFSAGSDSKTIAQMRALGYEINSQTGVSQSNIYDSSWNLKAPFRTAGRSGDAVGPGNGSDGLVGQIMNPNRYGPKALGGGGGSTVPSAPSNLRVQ